MNCRRTASGTGPNDQHISSSNRFVTHNLGDSAQPLRTLATLGGATQALLLLEGIRVTVIEVMAALISSVKVSSTILGEIFFPPSPAQLIHSVRHQLDQLRQ